MQINQYWVDVKTSLLNVIMLFVQAMQLLNYSAQAAFH
jgi:hypothetical protein